MKVQLLLVILGLIGFVAGKRLITPNVKPQSKNVLRDNRVVGGQPAGIAEAVYQISLQGMYMDHMCGGAIIGDRWILTAAHCVFGYNPTYLRVVTGTNKWKEPGAVHFVEDYAVPCNYDYPLYANDIALVTLNDTIKFDQYTQPIPLATKELEDGDEIILTGWGSTELWSEPPDDLQLIKLKYINKTDCREKFTGGPDVDDGHLCTFTRAGEGACHGDSGGPLISGGQLVGAVNFGEPCARGKPDVHAKIFYYRDWIRRVMTGCNDCKCVRSDIFEWNK